MNRLLYVFILLLMLGYGCQDNETEYLFPKDYFPAYPESYWIFSDGTMMKVSPGYHKHDYYEELGNNITSEQVYVPKIDNDYVYEYAITQKDNREPLKQLLSENYGDDWRVSSQPPNGQLRRKVVNRDTTVTLNNPVENNEQKKFDSCIVVIEYFKDTIAHTWQTKEIYAPKIGLIRQEIRRGEDSLVAKELVKYYISEDI